MTFKRFLPVSFVATIAITPMLTCAPALADEGTDAAVGAVVGAVVGSLLLDAHRDNYYYAEGQRPIYVSEGYSRRWYQHRDPDFWRSHHHDFYESHDWHHQDREWNHGDRGWNHGDQGWNRGWNHEDHDWHHGDHGHER